MQIGDKFHRWTVISERYKRNPSSCNWYVDCICECGTKSSVHTSALTAKKKPSKSCGCIQREVASLLKTEVPIGKIFGKLTIIEDLKVIDGRRYVLTSCSCGTENYKVRWDQVESGHTSSCGCYHIERVTESSTKHGMCGSGIYYSWQAMKDRCANPKSISFPLYGGRGVTYPRKWETFEGFYEDMGDSWYEDSEIDRIDNDLGYSKENCRWALRDVSNHNKGKSNCTSEYKGIYWVKDKEKWHARLQRNGIYYLSKYFNNKEDAARAYDEVSFEIYGDRPNEKLLNKRE